MLHDLLSVVRKALIFLGLLTLSMALGMGFWAASVKLGLAHNAPSGWPYPSDCCDDLARECDMLPRNPIVGREGPYVLILIRAGEHKNVKQDKMFRIHEGRVRASGDSDHHACISPSAISAYCLFLPPMG